MRFFYPVVASLIASSLDLSKATPACPAVTYTSAVSHSDNGLTVEFQPNAGQARPDWVVAHITKDYPSANPSVNIEVNIVDKNQTNAGASYNATTGIYSWLVAPDTLHWTLSDTPAYSFSYGVNTNSGFATCDTDVSQPANWFTVKAACPSIPYTQVLNVTDSNVYVSFTGHPGYAQTQWVNFGLGKNCNTTSTISSYLNLHAQDINSTPGCGYSASTQTWYCNVPKATLNLNPGDEPCVQSTYAPAGSLNCQSIVTYPGFAFEYQTSNWTTCTATCGGGVQTRSATCIGNDGTPDLTGYSCDLLEKPVLSQTCNAQLCPVWVNGTYGSCSTTCGGGVQTRAVTCVDPNTNQQMPSPSACASAAPSSSQTCNTNLCPGWNPATWSSCSTTCGTGVQTRSLVCALPDATVDTTGNSCANAVKPVTTQACTAAVACPTVPGSTQAPSTVTSAPGSNSTVTDKKTHASSAFMTGASANIIAFAMAFLSLTKFL